MGSWSTGPVPVLLLAFLVGAATAFSKNFVNSSMPEMRPTFVVNFDMSTVICQHSSDPTDLHLHEMSILCDGKKDCFTNPAMHDESFPYCERKCNSTCNNRGACLYDGEKPQCYCNSGFSGPSCELVDKNECLDRPCHMMAHCQNTLGGYNCECFKGFHGDGYHCADIDECATEDICPEHSVCVNLPGTHYCNCTEGFAQKGDALLTKCVDINECELAIHNCDKHQMCENTVGGFTCVSRCTEGYEYVNGECVDIDECRRTNLCDPRAECFNSPGSYSCVCEEGMTGDGKHCEPITDCSQRDDICDRHALCIPALKMCYCQAGYAGDGLTCHDVNECEASENMCANQKGNRCVNVDGGYICCDEGMDDERCIQDKGAFCSGGCGLNAWCSNRTCECLDGFSGDPFKKCTDINECDADNMCPGVGQWCVNTLGNYTCCGAASQEAECQGAHIFKTLDGTTAILHHNYTIGEGQTGEASEKQAGGFIAVGKGIIRANGTLPSISVNSKRACTSYCPVNSECVNGFCECLPGFGGNPHFGCEDINECLTTFPCQEDNDHWCLNTEGSFLCCDRNSSESDCLGLEIVPGGMRLTHSQANQDGDDIFASTHNESSRNEVISSHREHGSLNQSEGGWIIVTKNNNKTVPSDIVVLKPGTTGTDPADLLKASSGEEGLEIVPDRFTTSGTEEPIPQPRASTVPSEESTTSLPIEAVTLPGVISTLGGHSSATTSIPITAIPVHIPETTETKEVKSNGTTSIVVPSTLKPLTEIEGSGEITSVGIEDEDMLQRGKVTTVATPTPGGNINVHFTTLEELQRQNKTGATLATIQPAGTGKGSVETTIEGDNGSDLKVVDTVVGATVTPTEVEGSGVEPTTAEPREDEDATAETGLEIIHLTTPTTVAQKETTASEKETSTTSAKKDEETTTTAAVEETTTQKGTTTTSEAEATTTVAKKEEETTTTSASGETNTPVAKESETTSSPGDKDANSAATESADKLGEATSESTTAELSGTTTLAASGNEQTTLSADSKETTVRIVESTEANTKVTSTSAKEEETTSATTLSQRTEAATEEASEPSPAVRTTVKESGATTAAPVTSTLETTTSLEDLNKKIGDVLSKLKNITKTPETTTETIVTKALTEELDSKKAGNGKGASEASTRAPEASDDKKESETTTTESTVSATENTTAETGLEIVHEAKEKTTPTPSSTSAPDQTTISAEDKSKTEKTTSAGHVESTSTAAPEASTKKVEEVEPSTEIPTTSATHEVTTARTPENEKHIATEPTSAVTTSGTSTEATVEKQTTTPSEKSTETSPTTTSPTNAAPEPVTSEKVTEGASSSPDSLTTATSTSEKTTSTSSVTIAASEGTTSKPVESTTLSVTPVETTTDLAATFSTPKDVTGTTPSFKDLTPITESVTSVIEGSGTEEPQLVTEEGEKETTIVDEKLAKGTTRPAVEREPIGASKVTEKAGSDKGEETATEGPFTTSETTAETGLEIVSEGTTVAGVGLTEDTTSSPAEAGSTIETVTGSGGKIVTSDIETPGKGKGSKHISIVSSKEEPAPEKDIHGGEDTERVTGSDGLHPTTESTTLETGLEIVHERPVPTTPTPEAEKTTESVTTDATAETGLEIVPAGTTIAGTEQTDETTVTPEGTTKASGETTSTPVPSGESSTSSATTKTEGTSSPTSIKPTETTAEPVTAAGKIEEKTTKKTPGIDVEIVTPLPDGDMTISPKTDSTKQNRLPVEVTAQPEEGTTKDTFALPKNGVHEVATLTPNNVTKCVSGDECGDDAQCERRTGACRCYPGFEGAPPQTQCTDVDECAAGLHKCHSSARCHNFVGGYACFCPMGYRKNDSGICIDIDECAESRGSCCSPNGMCFNKHGSYGCKCKPGFFGDGYNCMPVEKRACNETELTKAKCGQHNICGVDGLGNIDCDSCKMGFKMINETCADVNECLEPGLSMCDKNAECNNLIGTYACQCKDGFRGDGYMCEDIDECTRNPCHPQAQCTNLPGSFICACPSGFEGDGVKECMNPLEKSCEDVAGFCGRVNHTACLSVRLFNGSLSSVCECEPGYRFNKELNTCEDIDECLENRNNCDPASATCINEDGGFHCECAEGYEGVGGVCVDVNECERGTAGCHAMAMCLNQPGSCGCKCMNGFTGDGTQCNPMQKREEEENLCTAEWNRLCLLENKTCHVDEEDVPQCGSCIEGHHPVNGTCQPLQGAGNCADPKKNTCDPNAECIDVHPGRHFCTCKIGYIGDGMRCDDIDECSLTGICHPHATCTNLPGLFTCTCNHGYTGNGFTCTKTQGPNCHLDGRLCHADAECNIDGKCKCKSGFEGDGIDNCKASTTGDKDTTGAEPGKNGTTTTSTTTNDGNVTTESMGTTAQTEPTTTGTTTVFSEVTSVGTTVSTQVTTEQPESTTSGTPGSGNTKATSTESTVTATSETSTSATTTEHTSIRGSVASSAATVVTTEATTETSSAPAVTTETSVSEETTTDQEDLVLSVTRSTSTTSSSATTKTSSTGVPSTFPPEKFTTEKHVAQTESAASTATVISSSSTSAPKKTSESESALSGSLTTPVPSVPTTGSSISTTVSKPASSSSSPAVSAVTPETFASSSTASTIEKTTVEPTSPSRSTSGSTASNSVTSDVGSTTTSATTSSAVKSTTEQSDLVLSGSRTTVKKSEATTSVTTPSPAKSTATSTTETTSHTTAKAEFSTSQTTTSSPRTLVPHVTPTVTSAGSTKTPSVPSTPKTRSGVVIEIEDPDLVDLSGNKGQTPSTSTSAPTSVSTSAASTASTASSHSLSTVGKVTSEPVPPSTTQAPKTTKSSAAPPSMTPPSFETTVTGETPATELYGSTETTTAKASTTTTVPPIITTDDGVEVNTAQQKHGREPLKQGRCTADDRSECHELAICDLSSGSCKCKDGFEGDGFSTCRQVTNIDCISNSSICHEQAACDRHTRRCACANGYIGDGILCSPDPQDCLLRSDLCSPDAICSGRRCRCVEGFTGDGVKCVSLHQRSANCSECDANAHCDLGVCSCNPGYFGNGLCCVPDPRDCVHFPGICHPEAGCDKNKRQCTCNKGFLGDGISCFPAVSCVSDPSVCHKNAICLPSGHCQCMRGFNGNGHHCERKFLASPRHELQQSQPSPCDNRCNKETQLCIDGDCVCKQGYDSVNGECQDIDECAISSPCHHLASCHNLRGSFRCQCPEGYIGDGHTCVQQLRIGELGVVCEPDGMTLVLANETRMFEGRIFVRGQAENPKCTKTFSPLQQHSRPYTFKVPFEHCNVRLEGNDTFATTVIVQKHPMFITTSADSYDLKCTYPVGSTEVESHVNVSELATTSTLSDQADGPICKLTVNNELRESVESATVGQALTLRLEVSPNDTYSILPKNCFAINIETGERYSLTDKAGCAIDNDLFPDWTKVSSSVSQAVFRTFKWPDSQIIRFQCDCDACHGDCPEVDCQKRREAAARVFRFRRAHPTEDAPVDALEVEAEQEEKALMNVAVDSHRVAFSRLITVHEETQEKMAQEEVEHFNKGGSFLSESLPTVSLFPTEGVCVRTAVLAGSALLLVLSLGFLTTTALRRGRKAEAPPTDSPISVISF